MGKAGAQLSLPYFLQPHVNVQLFPNKIDNVQKAAQLPPGSFPEVALTWKPSSGLQEGQPVM